MYIEKMLITFSLSSFLKKSCLKLINNQNIINSYVSYQLINTINNLNLLHTNNNN